MESATERGDSTAVAALNHSDRTKGSRHSSAAPEVNLLRAVQEWWDPLGRLAAKAVP